jgi:enamine deaminase RidA (YjgF/YER057c/UK114 family)
VLVGDHLMISGTTALASSGEVIGAADAYLQTRNVLAKIRKILASAGFTIHDVVRTRMFVTNISYWKEYARAHREVFENVRPASAIVQVAKLVDPRLLVEIEVEAIRGLTLGKNIEIPEEGDTE